MPFTFSIVLSTQKSGAICTIPPIDTTIRMPISRMSEFFSKTSCFIAGVASFGRRHAQGRRRSDTGLVGDVDRLVTAHGAPEVVGHDQRAQEEQQATHCADHVVGL